MRGFRILEVAEYIFVPAATALLADWGAEVIKIEPVERGDAARGLSGPSGPGIRPLYEHANRGKRSLALDLSTSDGREILYTLCASADVFISNKVGRVRRSLEIDLDDIRAHNPRIVYVRGTGQGERGPEADRGSYDLLNFWHRTGASSAAAAPDGTIPFMPAPGFGDTIGAMVVAGGVMGALLHRERTGEAPIVDVSLLSTGMWAMGAGIAQAAADPAWSWPPPSRNPLAVNYRAQDGRWIALCCLQAGRYWAQLCELIDRPELIVDPRFVDHESLMANSDAAQAVLRDVFAERPLPEWEQRLESFSGQWAVVQDVRGSLGDVQAQANGYLQECSSEDGEAFTLVSAPVQFDEEPATTGRGPGFNEHGDAILGELGFDWDHIVDLKVRGVVG